MPTLFFQIVENRNELAEKKAPRLNGQLENLLFETELWPKLADSCIDIFGFPPVLRTLCTVLIFSVCGLLEKIGERMEVFVFSEGKSKLQASMLL